MNDSFIYWSFALVALIVLYLLSEFTRQVITNRQVRTNLPGDLRKASVAIGGIIAIGVVTCFIGGVGAARNTIGYAVAAAIFGYVAWKVMRLLLPRTPWEFRLSIIVIGTVVGLWSMLLHESRERQQREASQEAFRKNMEMINTGRKDLDRMDEDAKRMREESVRLEREMKGLGISGPMNLKEQPGVEILKTR